MVVAFSLVALLFLCRLFYLQLVDDTYKLRAESNVIRKITTYPSRGLVMDRKGKLVVNNAPIYDIMVVPREAKGIDTTKLCRVFEISEDYFVSTMQRAKKYSNYKASVFLRQLKPEFYSKIQEYLYQFPGFYSQVRTIRSYPYQNAPHLLGYLGEVNKSQMDTSEYYNLGDYIGISGIERKYEDFLRGQKGESFRTVNVFNNETGVFRNGDLDKEASAGKNLELSIDIDLQAYGELLMQNKVGSIVAIEPKSGEILSMVSSPFYDPNVLTGRDRGEQFIALNKDSLKPLFNRAMMAQYPPGSTFKPLVGLIALEDKIVSPWFYYPCTRYYQVHNLTLKCSHDHRSAYNMKEAIKESCNPYFWHLFRSTIDRGALGSIAENYDHWVEGVRSFGFGRKLNIDMPSELSGNVPQAAYYSKLYGDKRWGSSTILSLGIGQGEITSTPVQLANYAAAIANRGKFYYPHLVRAIDGIKPSDVYTKVQATPFSAENIEHIIDGMFAVVESPSAWRARIPGIDVCGKTGTAQNPHGDDHSLFIAFAPKEAPEIAIAVVVENAGFGSRFAAPIAGLMIEKFLSDSISTKRKAIEEKILEADLINLEKQENESL